jgi:hypothetical protein
VGTTRGEDNELVVVTIRHRLRLLDDVNNVVAGDDEEEGIVIIKLLLELPVGLEDEEKDRFPEEVVGLREIPPEEKIWFP